MSTGEQQTVEVWADWAGLAGPRQLGTLNVIPSRGKQIFSFEFDRSWLGAGDDPMLDPELRFFDGPQYPGTHKRNFGLFLDPSPDRWGRFLMDRREALLARDQGRPRRSLHEVDYLLGVYDVQRMGGLRFKSAPSGPFLDDNKEYASPPWTSLRELEHASLSLEQFGAEKDPQYSTWLRMLVSPGGSLGGARPKAGVIDPNGELWIAKFPSHSDVVDTGAWEYVLHKLAQRCAIGVSEAQVRQFGSRQHTFLTKRFDRFQGKRIHFASAMTLLNRSDGDDYSTGTSYLEIVEFILRHGADPEKDLEQLWRRIAFSIFVSNVDDHLRNHGFLLTQQGWVLSPAYDMNPNPRGNGLKLNISETDNSLEIELAFEVAGFFRIKPPRAKEIAAEIANVVGLWRVEAKSIGLSSSETGTMEGAFRTV